MTRPRFVWPGALFLAGVLFFPDTLEAAVASRLVYGRAPSAVVCPDEAELRTAVRARLGYDPFFPWADQTIVVHVAPRPNRRMSGKVYLVDSMGRASPEREFTTSADECGELVLALALAIAMTLDPLHGTTTAAPTSSRSANAPVQSSAADERGSPGAAPGSGDNVPSPAVADDANGAPGANPSRSSSDGSAVAPAPAKAGLDAADRSVSSDRSVFHLDAGASALASTGIMPGISAGFAPFLRVRRSEFSFAAEGRLEVLALNDAQGDRANVSLVGGAAVPCIHLHPMVGCAALLLGSYRARGADAAPKEASALFTAAGIRIGAEIPLGSGFWGFVRAEGLVNVTRHDLTLAGESWWRIPAASFTLSAGALASIL